MTTHQLVWDTRATREPGGAPELVALCSLASPPQMPCQQHVTCPACLALAEVRG